MDYQPINLKHIREYVFKMTQEEMSKVLDISERTYQKYEYGDIPHKKISGLREKIAEYAKIKHPDFDFESIPDMNSDKKYSLSEFDDHDIIDYIGLNIDRFKSIPSFKFVMGLTELERLEKKIQQLESRSK